MLFATVPKQVQVAEIASIFSEKAQKLLISQLHIGEFLCKNHQKRAEIAEVQRQQTRTPLPAVNHHFDNRIVDADAPSYVRTFLGTPYPTVLPLPRRESTRRPQRSCEHPSPRWSAQLMVHCTQSTVRINGDFAMRLASRWDKSYSNVMSWVRIHYQFAVFRAVDLRLRGSRRRLGGLAICDGVGLGVGR